MKIATSIMASKNHAEIENQKLAIESWKKLGFSVISCNVKEEIDVLKTYFKDIEFYELKRSGKNIYGKPYPHAYDLIQVLENQEDPICGIINSDIHLRGFSNSIQAFIEKETEGKMLYLHRYDIDKLEQVTGKYYFSGIDAFFFNKKNLHAYSDENFFVGRPEWDHWMVYSTLMAGLDICEIKNPVAFHVKHQQRWKPEDSNATVLQSNRVSKLSENISSEDYYHITNTAMSDLSKVKYISECTIELEECTVKGRASEDNLVFYDIECGKILADYSKYLAVDTLKIELGLGFLSGNERRRICALNGNLKEKYAQFTEIHLREQTVSNKEQTRSIGNILCFYDADRLEILKDIEDCYLYPAGRATRLFVEYLNSRGRKIKGVVDRDINLRGSSCCGYEVKDPMILDDVETYKYVVIISNLYAEEIFESLVERVGEEKVILI